MSRHAAIDRLTCCAPPSAASVDWSRFVADAQAVSNATSPIDVFYESHTALIKLSSLVGNASLDPDASALLAGQILLGYVSATELFLRQTIASLVRLCPYIRQHNHNQMIPFGAIEYYGKSLVEQSLTERVSFSEVGSIRKQLKDRLRIEVRDATSLSRSISDFEKLCQLRHALVHAHGVINSSNAALLLGASPHRSHKADIDTQCIQWAAAVTVNLVRDVTLEVIRSTLWLWIEAKYLSGNARSNRHRIAKLIKSLGSKSDADSGRSGTTEVDIRVAIRTVVAQVNGPDALARTSKA